MNSIYTLISLFVFAFACSDSGTSKPSTVRITSPSEGELVKRALVLVKGEAEHTDIVTVNGKEADVVGGLWEIKIPFSQGAQIVTAKAPSSAQDKVQFKIDSFDPKLSVITPGRGTYITEGKDPDTVTVSGQVEEAELDILTVNQQIIKPEADGTFSYQFKLTPGLNEINVSAIDKAGNKAEDIRGVMYGKWTDPLTDIVPGTNLFIRESMMKDIENTVQQVATPEMVKTYIASSFADQFTLNSISFDPLEVSIILKKGYIATEFMVKNLKIDGVFKIGETEIDTSIEVDRIRASQHIIPFVTTDGGFDLRFENEVLDLEEDDVRFNVGGISQDDASSLRRLVVKIAKAGFGYLLSEAVFDQLIDPNVLIRKTELLGREIIFHLKLLQLDIFTDGILIKTSFVLPADKPEDVRNVPGALKRPVGAAGGGEPKGDIFFTTSQYALDRTAHGIWRSGLFHVALEDSQFANFTLPFELTAAGLSLALDSRITNIAGPDAPVILRLRPQLPPVVELDEKTNKVHIKMGEFLIDFIVVDGSKETLVATLSSFFDLDVTVNVKGFLVELAFETRLRADLIQEPEFDLDDQQTEALFQDLIALIPKIFEQNLHLKGEADVFWVTLNQPNILIHGIEKDYLSFGMEVVPNLDALP